MSLFDKNFFPTPEAIIEKMVAPYAERLSTATILEPSAGSGAILDFITEKGIDCQMQTSRGHEYTVTMKAPHERVYAIEKNVELQMLLQQKNYRLVADDFLRFVPDTCFDLILMNPPFENGDDHLLHAWEILHHGDIACLLNAETIRNPYSAARKRLAKIIEANGSVEDLGRCFSTAERRTDVEVVLVRLHKEDTADEFKINLDAFSSDDLPNFGEMASDGKAIEQSSRLDAFIRSWDMAKRAAVEYIKAREVLQLYMGCFLQGGNTDQKNFQSSNVITALNKQLDDNIRKPGHMYDAYNTFVGQAKKAAWDMIFREIGLARYMTRGLREKLDRFRETQGSFAITKDNIQTLFNYIILNLSSIMDEAVVEVYDKFTRYHKGNTSCNEGWKTNKQFYCNRKVVLPDVVYAGFLPERYGYNSHYSTQAMQSSGIDDIDKAMCWLSGRNFDSLTGEIEVPGLGKAFSPKDATINEVIRTIAVGDQQWHESAFFRVKCFKKGTLHLEFKDESLWARFNQVVNEGKNMIGSGEAA